MSSFQAHERIGQNIRKYRKKRGPTQEELAEKANLHPVYVSEMERADRAVTVDAIMRMTKALRIKLRRVVGDP